jgi:hypothetical protein
MFSQVVRLPDILIRTTEDVVRLQPYDKLELRIHRPASRRWAQMVHACRDHGTLSSHIPQCTRLQVYKRRSCAHCSHCYLYCLRNTCTAHNWRTSLPSGSCQSVRCFHAIMLCTRCELIIYQFHHKNYSTSRMCYAHSCTTTMPCTVRSARTRYCYRPSTKK